MRDMANLKICKIFCRWAMGGEVEVGGGRRSNKLSLFFYLGFLSRTLHGHLDTSQAITAESSSLRRASH